MRKDKKGQIRRKYAGIAALVLVIALTLCAGCGGRKDSAPDLTDSQRQILEGSGTDSESSDYSSSDKKSSSDAVESGDSVSSDAESHSKSGKKSLHKKRKASKISRFARFFGKKHKKTISGSSDEKAGKKSAGKPEKNSAKNKSDEKKETADRVSDSSEEKADSSSEKASDRSSSEDKKDAGQEKKDRVKGSTGSPERSSTESAKKSTTEAPKKATTQEAAGSKYENISDGKSTEDYNTDPVPRGKPEPVEPEETKIDKSLKGTVTLYVECSTVLDHMDDLKQAKKAIVPSDGVIYGPEKVTFSDGESAFDVLKRVMTDNKIQMEFEFTPGFNSDYIEGIGNLYELDCGPLSGWMYQVNGWSPNYGCSRYVLQDGDKLEFRYTCDLGRDLK